MQYSELGLICKLKKPSLGGQNNPPNFGLHLPHSGLICLNSLRLIRYNSLEGWSARTSAGCFGSIGRACVAHIRDE